MKKKPLLTVDEQIIHMKEKGISFDLVKENEAYEYLYNNNNYFKVASYRKNYEQRSGGVHQGEYISLDFAYLKDLAIIDMELRYLLVQLALDIEHFSKLHLLRFAEKNNEDGYAIVEEYVNSLSEGQKTYLKSEIDRNAKNVYCGALVEKYRSCLPLWVFLEIIPFGRLVDFWGFCAKRYDDSSLHNQFYVLRTCKDIRNASAHSSCILNDLHNNTASYSARYEVQKAVSVIPGISSKTRIKRMSNVRIQQIVTLLYMHRLIVSSAGVKRKAAKKLHVFTNRMNKHKEFYESNLMISSSLGFLEKVIDNWYPIEVE